MTSENRGKPKWESIVNAVSIAAIPVCIAVGGWLLQSSLADQSIKRDYVQLAVSILKNNDTTQQNQELRAWAVQLLNSNSPIKLDTAVQRQLRSGQILLPSADVLSGKELFQMNCSPCHETDRKSVGPKLNNEVISRRTNEWLIKWITNSSKLIASGDEEAKKLFEEYNMTMQPAYPTLNEGDISKIISYLKSVK